MCVVFIFLLSAIKIRLQSRDKLHTCICVSCLLFRINGLKKSRLSYNYISKLYLSIFHKRSSINSRCHIFNTSL